MLREINRILSHITDSSFASALSALCRRRPKLEVKREVKRKTAVGLQRADEPTNYVAPHIASNLSGGVILGTKMREMLINKPCVHKRAWTPQSHATAANGSAT